MARHKNRQSTQPETTFISPASVAQESWTAGRLDRRERLLVVAFSSLILLSGVAAFFPTFRAVFSSSSVERTIYVDDLNDGGEELRSKATVAGAPVFNEFGVGVLPGKEFQIAFRGPKERDELPYVRIWMYGGEVAENLVTFRSAGVQETLRIGGPVQSLIVRPSKVPRGDNDYQVIVTSLLPSGRIDGPVLILDRLELGLRIFPKGEIQPGCWSIFPSALLPLLLLQLLSGTSFTCRTAFIVTGLGSGAVALAGIGSALVFPVCAVGVMAATLLDFVYGLVRRAGGRVWETRQGRFLLGASLAGVALAVRWQWYIALLEAPLAPDAAYYEATARAMTSLYDTGVREPFHMWMIWLFSTVTAWGPVTLRLLTVVFSVLEAGVLFALACEFLPIAYAAAVLLLYAFNPLLAASAPMGLREEELPIAWMVFLLGCIWGRRAPGKWRYQTVILAGAVGLVLTRINALSLVVPLYAVYAYMAGWPRKYALVTGAALALLVAPHFIHNKVRNGDWMKSTNIHAQFLRNLEFAGSPGHITREEFDRDAFAGAPVTMGEFLLGMHSPANLTTGTLAGLWKMSFGDVARNSLLRIGWKARVDEFRNPVMPQNPPRIDEWFVFVLYMIGILGSFRMKNGWVLPVSILIYQLPIAFIAGWGLLMVRHMSNHTPLMLLLAGIGASAFMGWATRRYRTTMEQRAVDDARPGRRP